MYTGMLIYDFIEHFLVKAPGRYNPVKPTPFTILKDSLKKYLLTLGLEAYKPSHRE